MLAVPKWMTESAIPVGFSLLLLQVIAEIVNHFANPDDVNSLSGEIDI